MRCEKCGSKYAAVRRTEAKPEGVTIQYIHCSECKADYQITEKVEPDFYYQVIMDLKYSYNGDKYDLTLASGNGIIIILNTVGKYDYTVLDYVHFGFDDFHNIVLTYKCESKYRDDPNGFTFCEHVLEVNLNPETCAQFMEQKPYQLREEALGGGAPELKEDFVKLLNECLLSQSDEESVVFPFKQKKKRSGCYIATSVYGTYDCPQVWILRRYRDFTLDTTWYGRLFIQAYYLISPTIVKWFGKKAWFSGFWHKRLDYMVRKLKSQGYQDTPYIDKY